MRADALGLWWRDEPPVKAPKAEKPKRTPPEPVWLRDDYLPGLEEALRFNVHIMNDAELYECWEHRDPLIFDVECYWNYFLVSFTSFRTGAIVYFEMSPGYEFTSQDLLKLEWIMRSFLIVGFNSKFYDVPITTLALAGKSCKELKEATNKLILEEWRPQDVLKMSRVKSLKDINHIDLIEVAPLQASLKIYGGRLHVPKMQDLPFHPEALLSPPQMAIVRWYNVNDLSQTAFLFVALKEQIDLRETLGNDYGVDLRSRSDAQIAEEVISAELTKLNGARPTRPEILPGTVYYYKVPQFLKYDSPIMNWALEVVRNAKFIVSEIGSIEMPKEVGELRLVIADNVYRMGIGGLHSSETKIAHIASKDVKLVDRDVTSYYPKIILNQQLYPLHLGRNFLRVYQTLVDRRIQAKEAGMKAIAESLKITVNGSYGKLGSKYSTLYSPDLLIQVTMTGQLALLMLIERIAIRGIQVISANTDGVVIKCPTERMSELEWVVAQWEKDTNFQTEETQYASYYGRDVNNYIAVKKKYDKKTKQWTDELDGVKSKGAYANPWNNPTNDSKVAIMRLHKNPVTTVCLDAVELLLTKNIPVRQTIENCKDITKFIVVRKVQGGAVKNGIYLGASLRWYYATEQTGEMVYAKSGNKVPRSDGAKPLLELPACLPNDIDFAWYEQEAMKILKDIAYLDA